MKKDLRKRTFWQSLLSLVVLIVFAYFALATFGGISQQKRQLADGRWEIAKHYSGGNVETTVGNTNADGLFEGPVKVTYEDDNYIVTHTEEVEMKAGERHGISKVTYPSGVVRYFCYEHGERVPYENCEKSAMIVSEEKTAYNIFSYKFPWFEFKLDALGFDSTYLESYIDTLESLVYSYEFEQEEFEDYYSEAIDSLSSSPYDTIIQVNAELSLYNGINLISIHEFRLATLSSYARGDSNTYNVVTTIYPNYLLKLNELEVTDTDFEGFCHVYDSIMASFDPIPLPEPGLIDSIDARMYRTLEYMYSDEDKSAIRGQLLKSGYMTSDIISDPGLSYKYYSLLKNQVREVTPNEVATMVMLTILEQFIYGDLINNAVKAAYVVKEGIIVVPTATTSFTDNVSPTSVTLNGNVISDGGGEIQSRGIVWGTGYNPTINDQIVYVGSGTGDFEASLTGLTEGETYYARTFAMNSAGFAYGNCITFVASSTTGILPELSNTGFEIYPNPARDYIIINLDPKHSKRIIFTLFDVHGKVVLQKELENVIRGESSVHLDLQNVQNGIYSCRIIGDDGIYITKKLMVNH